jgi:hypothetical protein
MRQPETPRVLIGAPWYKVEPETAFCVAQTYLRLAMDGPAFIDGRFYCASVCHARARLVAQFMAMDCSHLLMIDGDMTFNVESVVRMLEHDVPFVAAAAALRSTGKFQVGMPGQGAGKVRTGYDPATGLAAVPRVGACFMLIRRDCIERLMARYPELWLEHEEIDEKLRPFYFAFFQTKAQDGWMPTEDFAFCDLLWGAEIPVLVDPWIEIGHITAQKVTGKLMDHMEF